ncbi:MAG: hypothetical protein QM489_04955 [Candidatus Izemoplasma sp.]
MLKKIFTLVSFMFLVLGLTGCGVNLDFTFTKPEVEVNQEVIAVVNAPKVPYAVEFNRYDSNLNLITSVDIKEYLYFSHICDGDQDTALARCFNLGKSIAGVFDMQTVEVLVPGGNDLITKTTVFNGYLYFSKEINGSSICVTTKYTGDDEAKINDEFCVSIAEGALLVINSSGTTSSGEEIIIDFKVEIVLVDNLSTIIVVEYDDLDQQLNTTLVRKEYNPITLDTNVNTTYVIITENYVDSNGNYYVVTTQIDRDSTIQIFERKYTNADGYIVLTQLNISFSTE